MGWFGDLLKGLAPVAASFIPGIGPIAGPALGAILNAGGGGGAGGYSPYASMIAGQLTSQRIPGQTQPGSYTPQPGSFGTYNYIPTGAEQIDPALISQIMNLGIMNSNVQSHGGWQNQDLLNMIANNPYTAGMQGAANGAGQTAEMVGLDLNRIQQLLHGGMAPTLSAATGANDFSSAFSNYQPVMQAGQNVADFASGMYAPQWDNAISQMASYSDLLGASQNNAYTPAMIYGANNIGQSLVGAGGGIQGTATGALSGAEQAAQQAVANPYAGQAQAGANTAGGMMTGTGQDQFNLGRTFTGQVASGLPAISSVLNTAFDPQQQLYDRTLGNVMDQIGTVMARTGTTDSGTGLRFAGDTLRDFNIDWQNNQLGRQTQGLNAYTSGMAGAGSQLGTGTNLQATGAQNVAAGGALPYQTYRGIQTGNLDTLGQLADLARITAGTVGAAGDLQLGGNAAGYNAYNTNLNDMLGFVDARQQGVQGLQSAYNTALSGLNTGANALSGAYTTVGGELRSGANQLSNTLGGLGNLGTQYGNIGTQGVNMLAASGQLPYGAYMQSYGDRNAGLTNYLANGAGLSNLSTAAIAPMQNYLGGVMQGANNASNAASGAQSATTNQNAQSAAGLTPLINSGLNWLGNIDWSNIFGGGGSGGSYGSVYNNNPYGYRPYTPGTVSPISYSY